MCHDTASCDASRAIDLHVPQEARKRCHMRECNRGRRWSRSCYVCVFAGLGLQLMLLPTATCERVTMAAGGAFPAGAAAVGRERARAPEGAAAAAQRAHPADRRAHGCVPVYLSTSLKLHTNKHAKKTFLDDRFAASLGTCGGCAPNSAVKDIVAVPQPLTLYLRLEPCTLSGGQARQGRTCCPSRWSCARSARRCCRRAGWRGAASGRCPTSWRCAAARTLCTRHVRQCAVRRSGIRGSA